jgi:hypothetical protein
MSDEPSAERLAALEARLRLVEDQLELHRLINTWGLAADTGNAEAAASLFADDGVLESDLSYLVGPDAVRSMITSDGQQALIEQGSAHIPAFPVLEVHGDEASASGYTTVFRHTEAGYEIWRVSANHWTFRRTPEGWRLTKRTNHVIDGGTEALELLAKAFDQRG